MGLPSYEGQVGSNAGSKSRKTAGIARDNGIAPVRGPYHHSRINHVGRFRCR